MSPARPSAAERLRGIALREQKGLSIAQIVRLVGGTQGYWSYHFARDGVLPPRPGRVERTPRAMVVMRHGRPVRRFSPAEDAQLLEMALQGLPITEIGRRLDPPRGYSAVCARLRALARHTAAREGA